MVATSAGEVGINLSADRLITDLDTADHLLQRFGRLNRFGETEGDAYVVYSQKKASKDRDDAPRLEATLGYLRSLPDISLKSLHDQPPPTEALSPTPHLAPLLPWHIDVWSMTSISLREWPSRPAVEYWLRGNDEKAAPPETYVAWREDVADLANPGVSQRDRDEVFECFPVIAQERLKQTTGRLCDSLQESNFLTKSAILIGADGEIHVGTLSELLENRSFFRYGTLLLPPGIGHLDRYGMVDWMKAAGELSNYDVSATETRRRVKLTSGEATKQTGLRWRYTVEIPTNDEGQDGSKWVYYSGLLREPNKVAPLFLADHREHVAKLAAILARRHGLDDRTVRIFEWAGRWHDAGKARPLWQRAAGNENGCEPLAKCSRLDGRALDGYRHELGSLLDAEPQLPKDFTADERDLALHLIAAHHGWARPHFPDRTFDKSNYRRSERAALDCARRLGCLQQRFGAWELAYLEGILRSADAIASADTSESPANA
jgi:CRISPR-associated endonuclease/helicase Cas3